MEVGISECGMGMPELTDIPSTLSAMAELFAGTSGWAYASWKPEFYPAKLKAAGFLSYYASRLNSVELNYTFRRFPTEKLLAGWIAATAPGFKFAVKPTRPSRTVSGCAGRANIPRNSSPRCGRWKRKVAWVRCCFNCRRI